MKYKIFYSYQSDINHDLNNNFLKEILSDIVGQVKKYKLELVFSFKGSSGQPPLADQMLESSENSDIFIGDLTYTSSRNNLLKSKGFNICNYAFSVSELKSDKKSPNPNVLIESGYSFAKKGYKRTIFVMNTAFGEAEELPIDLKHLRHPILYSLSERDLNNPTLKQSTKKELREKIKEAILDAINTDIAYQRTRYKPFVIHQDWTDPGFKNNYILTPFHGVKINQYRKTLNQFGKTIRIESTPKSGKTRLIYELFRANGGFTSDERINKLLYYDMNMGGVNAIHNPLLDLKISNQDKIVVIDNCSLDDHNRIKDILDGTNVSLITINK